ncbi:MAG: hypothetical protein HN712_14005 [Gemmatimonadetes bacterium]|jgi:hypothetical protein|nr:hypothetical protein [Gemmatimonadota bacterium]MBT6147687.1 hypothetical protein [Gemmatimonadota bacterium]MBT7861432.1 hypothetical protein [Gemmatimonadota bacterium]
MAEHHSVEVNPASLKAGHETTDASAGPLLKIGIAMAVLVIMSFVGIVVLQKVLAYYQPLLHEDPHPLRATRIEEMTEPRLEIDAPRLRLALRAEEDALLTVYTWVDQAQGKAKIPVERAMDLLAKRGLPIKTGIGAASQ